jgi:hypothetical protein
MFLAMLALVFLTPGCVWRTRKADYSFGPSFYRFNRPSPGNSVVYQTLHVPLLVEGGRQRVALVPRREGASPLPTNRSPEGLFIHPEPDHWRFSPFYLRMPLREPPIFIRRSVVGAAGRAGFEERSLSLGYSATTLTWPEEEALYDIQFDSARPLEATAVVTPLTAPSLQPTPPGEKGKP